METTIEAMASSAHSAHCDVIAQWDDRPPRWEDITNTERDAWRAAVRRILSVACAALISIKEK